MKGGRADRLRCGEKKGADAWSAANQRRNFSQVDKNETPPLLVLHATLILDLTGPGLHLCRTQAGLCFRTLFLCVLEGGVASGDECPLIIHTPAAAS